MEYKTLQIDNFNVEIKMSVFSSGNGIKEFHVMINLKNPMLPLEQQIKHLNQAVGYLCEKELINNNTVLVWRRYFMSDPVNQFKLLPSCFEEAVSLTGQAPLNNCKMALWCYFIQDADITKKEDITIVKHSGYSHLYQTGLHHFSENEYQQTLGMFKLLQDSLKQKKISFAENLIRTWIYVQGVDLHYNGMVKARKEVFVREGMTPDTHYVASTGIEGKYIYQNVLVYMDAYSVKGLKSGQIKYLYASKYLSPTSKYGVTFERGTAINYGDRCHIFISGTASIDENGDVVFPMDILMQAQRTLENIQALLKEAGATFKDLAQLIVYLRDIADYPLIKEYVESNLPDVPKVFVLASVCRPGWLIEMECIAIYSAQNSSFEPF